jgi:hypothetical protein
MSYQDFVTEDRRLAILKLLANSEAYTANEYLLQTTLHTFGHAVGRDRLRTDLAWLAEQSLIRVDVVADVRIAKLAARGEDAAAGRVNVPGVKRPSAGD